MFKNINAGAVLTVALVVVGCFVTVLTGVPAVMF